MKKLLLLGLLPTFTWGASELDTKPVGGSATSGAVSETSPAAAEEEHPVITAFNAWKVSKRYRLFNVFDSELGHAMSEPDGFFHLTKLLQLGLDSNMKTGTPPFPMLAHTIVGSRLDQAFLLLAYGANPDCGRHTNTWTYGKPSNYSDISTFCCPYGAYPNNDSWEKHVRTLDSLQLLIFFGANVNNIGKPDCPLMSLLMVGAENGYLAIVKFCLQNGADVNLKYYGKTALDMAMERGANKSGGQKPVDEGEFDAVITCLGEHTPEKAAEIQAAIEARKARPIAEVIGEWAGNNNRSSLDTSSSQRRLTVYERILYVLNDPDVVARLAAYPPARRG